MKETFTPCPFHRDLGLAASSTRIATWDDEVMGIEMVRYRCDQDPSHVWEQPSKMFMLRWIGWGVEWKNRRDRYQGRE